MTRLKLRYINRYEDNRGKVRFYFRRPGGKNIALPGEPFSKEFMSAYQAALGDSTIPDSARAMPGTIDALTESWYRTPDYRQLADATKTTYRGIVERFRAEHGSKRVSHLEAKHIRKLIQDKQETPSAANNLLSLIKLLMRHAVELEWRKDDPTFGVRKLRVQSEGFHSWTEDEIAAFEARHPLGTKARLALALLLYTGQRRSDVVTMGRQHVNNELIAVVQAKTKHRLSIPIHPVLRETIDAGPSGNLNFLVTEYGKPFATAGFGNWFRDRCNEAGLAHCSAHGLRKAASRRLADAGASIHQIAAITGHKSLKEVERYTRDADQVRLAREAVNLFGRKG